jgi:hypothetical protein
MSLDERLRFCNTSDGPTVLVVGIRVETSVEGPSRRLDTFIFGAASGRCGATPRAQDEPHERGRCERGRQRGVRRTEGGRA